MVCHHSLKGYFLLILRP